MLPVFLWRVREALDLTSLVRKARQPASGRALGFFLQVAAKLGRTRGFDQAIAALRSSYAAPARPIYFFHGTRARPFEKMVTDSRTPTEARRWGLLMNMPWDSFTSYFRKAAPL